MITIQDLATELDLDPSALRKTIKKMGIIPGEEYRQTEVGVRPLKVLTDAQEAQVRRLLQRRTPGDGRQRPRCPGPDRAIGRPHGAGRWCRGIRRQDDRVRRPGGCPVEPCRRQGGRRHQSIG